MAAPLSALARRDVESVLHPYTNLKVHGEQGPLVIVRGKGIYVYDEHGREYIEAMSGLWCASLGFGEEELADAAAKQMRELPFYHSFNHKAAAPVIELADKLKRMVPVPMAKVLFANSGSEANDSLVKLVWYYNNARGKPKKKKIISRLRAYHGVTLVTASLTGLPNNHRSFDLPLAGVLHTDCPHYYRGGRQGETEAEFVDRLAKSLEALIVKEDPETVAAFIAEPVMGGGGVVVPPAGYFARVQEILARHDILFLDDEVICGFGRTGNMFGAETFGLAPDTMTLAKALSAAYLPISAALINERIAGAVIEESNKIGVFAHGFTYSGHPVPAAVALKTLEIYERRDILGHVRRIAPHFQRRLRALADHPLVGEVRGVGLIGALELVADKTTKRAFAPPGRIGTYAAKHAEANGMIVRALVDSIALCPPLIITEAEIDAMFERLTRSLDATEAWVAKERLRDAA
ncbi:MAG: aspartate aminotransferase family protein [Alphaproteobacteria bacterium]|nr:aspartate aminotransferase family protein [Alphaproteobacteria bacterium]